MWVKKSFKKRRKNIWRESKKYLPLHPQSREMAVEEVMKGNSVCGRAGEVGKPKRNPKVSEKKRKNFRKNLEVKIKKHYLCATFSKERRVL